MSDEKTLTPLRMANELGAVVIPVMLNSIREKLNTTQIDFQVNKRTEKELDERFRRILAKQEWDGTDVRQLAAYFCTLDYLACFHG